MKKNLCFPLLTSLILLILPSFFQACKQDAGSETPKDLHLALADTIVQAYNTGRPPHDLAERTLGTVEIVVHDDRIVLEHVAEGANEVYMYFIQTDKRVSKLKPGKLGQCEVIYTERQLIVNSLTEQKTLLFYILSDEKPWYEKQIKGLKSYGGYGLGLRKMTLGSPYEKAPFCKCVYPDTYAFHCNAGGSEQINCATSNLDGACRVSCDNKTYPCCDMGQE